MKRTKVLILHFTGPPVIGGVERVIAGQARVLSQYGHDVSILVGRGDTSSIGISTHTIPELDSQHPLISEITEMLKLGKVPDSFEHVRETIIDGLKEFTSEYPIWIVHNVATMPQNLAFTHAIRELADKRWVERLILWHHDIAWGNPRYQWATRDEYPWNILKEPWPDWVIHVTITEVRRRQLAKLWNISESKIRVIPNGIDASVIFRWRPQTFRLLDEIGLLSSDIILVQPVRITPRKNIERALHIIKALTKITDSKIHLIVSGPPDRHISEGKEYFHKILDLRNKLGLQEVVRFPCAEPELSDITREGVIDLLTLADGILLTSVEEGFGLPVLEAGVARIPVFAEYLSTLEEVGNGYIHFFKPDDPPDDVAKMILNTLETDLPGKLRRHVRKNFFWDSIYRRHMVDLLTG